jgi:predicted RNase H-like HicB family nuclease
MEFEVNFELEEDGRWIAAVERLPGVMAYGVTREEARAKVVALRKKLLKNSLRIKKMQNNSGMRSVTDNCDQDETQDSGFGERLVQYMVVISLNLFVTYFFVRVAWDIFVSSYASMGVRWTLCVFSCSIIYFVVQSVANPADVSSRPITEQSLTPEERYNRRNLLLMPLDLFLPILAVVLAVYFDNSRLSLQIAPIYILLLIPLFGSILHFYRLVHKSIQRKLKFGSILPSASMGACCRKAKSSQYKMSLAQSIPLTVLSLLYATLWTGLLNYDCYVRRSPLNQSIWEMIAFWGMVLIFWLRAAAWIVFTIRTIIDRRNSREMPSN